MHEGRQSINVEVAYALPTQAVVKTYQVDSPATIGHVLGLAAADPSFAGIDVMNSSVGVFGRLADMGQELKDRDRIEIYRPLAADPKSARRARARRGLPSRSGRS